MYENLYNAGHLPALGFRELKPSLNSKIGGAQ